MYKELIKSYISYTFLLLLILFLYLFFRQPFFLFLLVALLILPAVSFLLFSFRKNTMSCRHFFHSQKMTLSDPANLFVELHNNSLFPITNGHLHLEISSNFYEMNESLYFTFSLPAYSTQTLCFPLSIHKCGMYHVKLVEFSFFNIIGLFINRYTPNITHSLSVLPPRGVTTLPLEVQLAEGLDESEESYTHGIVSANISDIRPYLPGDRLQQIHWKLTSKLDQYMVKLNEFSTSNVYHLLIELYQPSKQQCLDDPSLSNTLDKTLQRAYSASCDLLENGYSFIFITYSILAEDFIITSIQSQEDLDQAFLSMYYLGTYEIVDYAYTLYQKSVQFDGTLVHITSKEEINILYV